MKSYPVRMTVVLVLLVAAIGIGAQGCAPQQGEGEEVYDIGVIGPLTGEGAAYGEAMKRGIELAIEEVNQSGGVNGHRLEAVYEDDQLLPKEGVAAFNKIVSTHDVPVIIGSAASRVTMTLAPLAEEQQVVLFSSISTTDDLRDAGDYIFRNVPPNSMQARTASKFVADELNAGNVAILYKNDDYGANLANAFRDQMNERGIEIVFDQPYDPSQRDFRNLLSQLKESSPEVVFFPGNYQDNGLILKQAREASIDAPFVGGDGAFSTELINIAGTAAQNSYFTMMGIPDQEKVKPFVQRYQEEFGEKEPNVFAYYAYDALKIIAKAIEEGGYTAQGIKEALYSMEYDGLTGRTSFDSFGEVNKPYSIYTVGDDDFQILDWRPTPSS